MCARTRGHKVEHVTVLLRTCKPCCSLRCASSLALTAPCSLQRVGTHTPVGVPQAAPETQNPTVNPRAKLLLQPRLCELGALDLELSDRQQPQKHLQTKAMQATFYVEFVRHDHNRIKEVGIDVPNVFRLCQLHVEAKCVCHNQLPPGWDRYCRFTTCFCTTGSRQHPSPRLLLPLSCDLCGGVLVAFCHAGRENRYSTSPQQHFSPNKPKLRRCL